MLCCATPAAAQMAAPDSDTTPASAHCQPVHLGSWAAQETTPNQRPASGWVSVQLPDSWQQRWPDWQGATWYRTDWQLPCPLQHHALSLSAIRTAGTVYWGDELLWSDRHTDAPAYSRSGNTPRWWPLSTDGKTGVQSVWVRVVSHPLSHPGLGRLVLGPANEIRDATEYSALRQRLGYTLTAAMSLAMGCVALCVWLWRRSEQGYAWFGAMQLCWAAYLGLLLSHEPLLGMHSATQTQVHMLFFLLYAQCFMVFSLRFVGLRWRLVEAAGWLALLAAVGIAVVNSSMPSAIHPIWALRWGAGQVQAACVVVIVQALRTRQAAHLWLALCWFGLLLVVVHDTVMALRMWDYDQTWAAFFSPIYTLMLSGMLGWQLAQQMRKADRFNAQLQQHVDAARSELASVLAQQHTQELEHAKLQERVHLSHDLHDGLGGSLVRSMALVEQAAPQLDKDRVLSMLKVLRDDLRQVIDVGSSRNIHVPDSPGAWLAPLRHRFTLILDELGMHAHWHVQAQWQPVPSALQCMTMSRFLEEAFANVLKHSRARSVCIRSSQPHAALWRVEIEDDGVGFDVASVQSAGMGIGMHSMQARLARVGGRLQVSASAAGSLLVADIELVNSCAQTPDLQHT